MAESSTLPATRPPLPDSLRPVDAARAWPADAPLAAILPSGARAADPAAAIALLSRPAAQLLIPHHAVRSARDLLPPPARGRGPGGGSVPFHSLPPHTPTASPEAGAAPTPLPVLPCWIGWIAYDAVAALEPRTGVVPSPDWPAAVWLRCEGAYVHDARTGRWFVAGDASSLPELRPTPCEPAPFTRGETHSLSGKFAYTAAVRHAIEYIRDGDIYQANIAHRLVTPFEGIPRRALLDTLAGARARHGAWLEWDEACADEPSRRRAVCSMSPELFLAFDPSTRRIVTRPMKGTARIPRDSSPAPAGPPLAPLEPLSDAKSRAELAMIVDLMRNDLGRVASFGSVRVDAPRTIERHADLLQGVATVSAVLREGLGLADLLRAAFPAGSITGCPRLRAMQIIDELEPIPRGPAFGSVGWVADSGAAALGVAIRTIFARGRAGGDPGSFAEGTLEYAVGAGIVADSDPEAEWRETLAKACVARPLIGPLEHLA